MDKLTLIMFAFGTVLAVIGAILVVLQKKGIVKPVITQTANGFDIASGETVMIAGTGLCTLMLYQISGAAAGVYFAGFLILYILIQVMFRRK